MSKERARELRRTMTDAERRQRGCRVIRFWNEEVFLCPDRVVEIIYDALLASAHSRAA
ncbi:MAG TPA: hypothetical protein VGM17_06420 [Rhizomicrobium sp.]